jgi:hypothetical protein
MAIPSPIPLEPPVIKATGSSGPLNPPVWESPSKSPRRGDFLFSIFIDFVFNYNFFESFFICYSLFFILNSVNMLY